MNYRYWVVYRDASESTDGAEVTTDSPLDGALGRAEAQRDLTAQGVDRPQITGWALRSARHHPSRTTA